MPVCLFLLALTLCSLSSASRCTDGTAQCSRNVRERHHNTCFRLPAATTGSLLLRCCRQVFRNAQGSHVSVHLHVRLESFACEQVRSCEMRFRSGSSTPHDALTMSKTFTPQTLPPTFLSFFTGLLLYLSLGWYVHRLIINDKILRDRLRAAEMVCISVVVDRCHPE